MTGINGINPNINVNFQPKVKKTEKKEEAKVAEQAQPQIQHKDADDVLKFMANTSSVKVEAPVADAPKAAKKSVKISEHISPERANDIAADMKKFEKLFAAVQNEVKNNFPFATPELAQKIAEQTMEKFI